MEMNPTFTFIPQDPFQHFIDNVADVKHDRELARLIAQVGLYNKSSNVHPKFRRFTYPTDDNKGIWNDPDMLASFLWANKDAWKAANIQSCLEIGTFTGYGFFVVSTFLKTFVNANMTFKTIDIVDIDQNDPVYNYIKDYFQKMNSDGIKGETYDLVLVDGSTEKEWLQKDVDNTKFGAKNIFFVATLGMRRPRLENITVITDIMSVVNRNDLLTTNHPRNRFDIIGIKGLAI